MIYFVLSALSLVVAGGAIATLMAASAKLHRLRAGEPGAVTTAVRVRRPRPSGLSFAPAAVAFSLVVLAGAVILISWPVEEGPLGSAQPTPATPATSDGVSATEPTGPPATGPPATGTAGPARFQRAYAGKVLPVPDCERPVHLDLDQPRAGVPAGESDLTVVPLCDGGLIELRTGRGVTAAATFVTDPGPDECLSLVGADPAPPGDTTVVREGETLCLVTPWIPAGRTRKVVRLEVTSTEPAETRLTATAWETT